MSAEPLLHIGYDTTGTRWLQRKVFSDPALGFTLPLSISVIDEAFLTLNPFTFDSAGIAARFRALFADAETPGVVPVVSHDRLSGRPANGTDAPAIADRLAAAFPTARVLIVIREQAEMMSACYKTFHIDAEGGRLSFGAFWKDRSVAERRAFTPRLERFEFHHLIARYQALFGRDRVHVVTYELLCGDATAFVSEIANFVGSPQPPPMQLEALDHSWKAGVAALLRTLNMSIWSLGPLATFQGSTWVRRVRYLQMRALGRLNRRAPGALSRRIERRWRKIAMELGGERFAESNRITAELTGLDLGSLGYPI